MILLDTVVVSELRKSRPNARVMAWMRGLHETDVFLSVVTIGEIERGIAKVRDSDFALALTRWLEELLRFYGDRILPVTPDIARRWGRLSAEIGHEGADLLVAATAAAHGLTVATRNVRHFAPTGVRVFDPFKAE
ncbi:MAG: type II toxin-antitoxin system VapC family toxin [Pseudomonadota bacterium]